MAMDFEQALRYELSLVSAVTNKVYPLNAPEQAIEPFVIYTSSEGQREQNLNGWATMREVDCEIQVVATSYGDVKSITKDVITKLLSMLNRSIGVDGVLIRDLEYDKPTELFDQDLQQYRSVIDIRVRY